MNPITSPVLFLHYFRLGVQIQGQQPFLMDSIIELLLQLLSLTHTKRTKKKKSWLTPDLSQEKENHISVLLHSLLTLDRWSNFMLSMMRLFWESSILCSWRLCSSSFLWICCWVTFCLPSRCSSDDETSSVVGTVVSRLTSSDSRSRELEMLAALGFAWCFLWSILDCCCFSFLPVT